MSQPPMSCQRCKSKRVILAASYGKDIATVETNEVEVEGYLPSDLGIGGGDSIEIKVCLECGQIQGKWPLPKAYIELHQTAFPTDPLDPAYEEDEDEEPQAPPKLSWAERKARANKKESKND